MKQIAGAVGVSIGTVERALNDKYGVSPATKARVLEAAKVLGYSPNLAARTLRAGRRLRIAVQLPRQVALFWDALREGIREAAALSGTALQVDFQSYPRLGEDDVPLFERALADGVDGLIIAPGDPAALAPHLEAAARREIPVVCVVTDAPASPRLASVSADSFTVGALAGELLGRLLPGRGDVGFFTGWLGTQDHAQKFHGFVSSVSRINTGLTLGPIVEARDEEEADRRTREVLRAYPNLKGLYVSTSNSIPILRAAQELGDLARLTVVTTDLFPELADWIRSGRVAATVYQRPVTQGRIALHSLVRYLQDGVTPPAAIRVAPHLMMRSNLDLELERLPVVGVGLRASARA
jgi:LacI family transcriptional regulator